MDDTLRDRILDTEVDMPEVFETLDALGDSKVMAVLSPPFPL